MLPILHLNGYKIANPTVLARSSDREVHALLEGNGWEAHFVAGDDPDAMHQQFAATLERCWDRIDEIRAAAHADGVDEVPRWPAIVLRSPKGWTGPVELNGDPIEGTFRAHQVPLTDVRKDFTQLDMLERWMRSYRPQELFDEQGRPLAEITALAPSGERRMGANPHANGGTLLYELDIPPMLDYAVEVPEPATRQFESTRVLGAMMRDIFTRNAPRANFRLFSPDEANSNRLNAVFEVENRCFVGPTISIDDRIAPDGRVLEVLSEHLCEGWLEGYVLTGRHGLFASYEAFAMVAASMVVQHAKWLEAAATLAWRAPVASLNILLTSTCWRQDHNGFSHQGPGMIDVLLSKRGTVARIFLPPDANCLLSVADHCFRSRNYVNLIVIDKQPQLQWLSMDAAIAHCAQGAGVFEWAGSGEGEEPDVVLACAGDIPTLETVAAAHWLRENAPELKLRVVNVVDLMALFPPEFHPHGMRDERFDALFTVDRPVVFAFHGYQRAIHEIVHGRPHTDRFHVRGFREQGTTTTPFNMVVLNGMSRYDLAAEAIRRSMSGDRAHELIERCETAIAEATAYADTHLDDPPEISEWRWTN